jgi:hypothetical protein
MCEENLFEEANTLNNFYGSKIDDDLVVDTLRAMGMNDDDLVKRKLEGLNQSLSMIEGRDIEKEARECFKAQDINFDEFRAKAMLSSLKKQKIQNPKLAEVLPDSLMEAFIKKKEDIKRRMEESFPASLHSHTPGECVICYDDINDCARKCARCANIFHLGCIEVAFVEYGKCPVCRA